MLRATYGRPYIKYDCAVRDLKTRPIDMSLSSSRMVLASYGCQQMFQNHKNRDGGDNSK